MYSSKGFGEDVEVMCSLNKSLLTHRYSKLQSLMNSFVVASFQLLISLLKEMKLGDKSK